jgi:hypothetical protein
MVRSHGLVLAFCVACAPGAGPTTDADGGVPANDAGPVLLDAGLPGVELTWFQCWDGQDRGTLSEDELAHCDARYRAPPTEWNYGIHFTFLNRADRSAAQAFAEQQTVDVNSVYASTGLHFAVRGVHFVDDALVTEGTRDTTKYPLGNFAADIVKHLGLEEGTADPVAALVVALRAAGASAYGRENLDVLDVDTEIKKYDFYKLIARTRPEVISVFVRPDSNDKSRANYPGTTPRNALSGMITLAKMQALSALPHEMGHYFGLMHTFHVDDTLDFEVENPRATGPHSSAAVERLEAMLGADLNGDVQTTWLPYDANSDTIGRTESAIAYARSVIGEWEFSYTAGFELFHSAADYVARRGEQTVFHKNFRRLYRAGSPGWSGQNCKRPDLQETPLICRYGGDADGEPLLVADAEHPLVAGTILFPEDRVNLMSYISSYTADGVRRKVALTAGQVRVIQLNQRMPERLMLAH